MIKEGNRDRGGMKREREKERGKINLRSFP